MNGIMQMPPAYLALPSRLHFCDLSEYLQPFQLLRTTSIVQIIRILLAFLPSSWYSQQS
jgi:hypothetical protein